MYFLTLFQATPTLLSSIPLSLLRDKLLSAQTPLRVLALGGEACPGTMTLRAWRADGCRTRFFNIYGITEVSRYVCCCCSAWIDRSGWIVAVEWYEYMCFKEWLIEMISSIIWFSSSYSCETCHLQSVPFSLDISWELLDALFIILNTWIFRNNASMHGLSFMKTKKKFCCQFVLVVANVWFILDQML